MKVGDPLNLQQYELQNAVIQNLASAPTSPAPKAGQKYYNTTTFAEYTFNGTTWQVTDATLATGIPNTALATNPLARANHTGTQLASTISNFATTAQALTLDTFAAPVAAVSANGQRITNLPTTPTATTDAVPQAYVDAQVQSAVAGIASKPSVRLVSTSNISSITGLLTVDGTTVTAGDRVLLTGQSTASQNGVYIAASGAWARPPLSDAEPNAELALGSFWFVEQGTTYSASQWRLGSPTSGTIVPGTTALTITQYGQAGAAYTAAGSGGLSLSGTAFSAVANTGVTVGSSGIGADFSIIPKKFSQTLGDGTTTAIVVTHNLGTLDIVGNVRDSPAAGGNFMIVDIQATTTNTATITFGTAPASNSVRVTLIG